jgi:hypothetical protein
VSYCYMYRGTSEAVMKDNTRLCFCSGSPIMHVVQCTPCNARSAVHSFGSSTYGGCVMFCEKCGTAVEPGSSWCANCGARLAPIEGAVAGRDSAPPTPSQSAIPIVQPPAPTPRPAIPQPVSTAPPAPPFAPKPSAAPSVPQPTAVPRPATPQPMAIASPAAGKAARSSGTATKIVLPVAILLVLGTFAFVAYKNTGSIREMIAKLLSSKAPDGTQPAVTDNQPTAMGQGVDSSTASPDTTAAISDTQPPMPVSQTAPADAQSSFAPSPGSVSPRAPASPRATTNAQSGFAPPIKGASVAAPPQVGKPVLVSNPLVQISLPEPVKQPPPAAAPDTVATSPPPKTESVAVRPPVKSPVEAAPIPQRGTLTWSGDAAKNQTVTIEGGMASFGIISGRLPRVPCMFTVLPSDVAIAETPSPSNGFNKIVLRFPKKSQFTVTINWETLH